MGRTKLLCHTLEWHWATVEPNAHD